MALADGLVDSKYLIAYYVESAEALWAYEHDDNVEALGKAAGIICKALTQLSTDISFWDALAKLSGPTNGNQQIIDSLEELDLFLSQEEQVLLKYGLPKVIFAVPDERVRNAHANEIDATEAAAYGVSLAAVEVVTGLVAVRRAETLTGADWYIAPSGDLIEDLESCIRLEVSGINAGASSDITRRLRAKDRTSGARAEQPARDGRGRRVQGA